MSNRFWTIFVLTWAFGPCILWVSVLAAVHWYYRLQRSMKLLMEQIHEAHHPAQPGSSSEYRLPTHAESTTTLRY